jgi:hypothetical protein
MFNGLRLWLRRVVQSYTDGFSKGPRTSYDSNALPKIKLGLIEGMNGRVLEVAVPNTNRKNYGEDWIYDFYIIQEHQKISDAVAMVMIMKGLEK